MAPRRYTMTKRHQALEQTRERIVDAVVQLHNEKGVVATTMQDIAARADVSLGTVYRHFPTILDVVPACGARIRELYPFPDVTVLASVTALSDRMRTLIGELYLFYERGERWIAVGFCERSQVPPLDEAMRALEEDVRGFVGAALATQRVSNAAARMAVALADFHTWRAFRNAGFGTDDAIELVAEILTSKLRGEAQRTTRAPRAAR